MRAYIWIWHSPSPGHVPAMAIHLEEKAQHAGYKAPVEKVGHRLGQLRRLGRRRLDLAV